MNAFTAPESNRLRQPGRLRGLAEGAREIDDTPVRVEGDLPDWLRGGLLLNGPALWKLPGGTFRHWFDGFAMLHRIEIGANGASYRSRFLHSADYDAAIAAGRPTLAGFGTADPMGFWQRMRHFGKPRITDNGAVVMSRIGTRWIAQTETPFAIEFDPRTLATLGPFQFSDTEEMHLMSAHGITERDGTYWNVAVALGPKCTYKVFKVAPGSTRREVLARWVVPKSGYLHALALTPGHVVVWEPAMRAQPLKFLFTGNSYIDNFTWSPAGGSRIRAVSRSDGSVRTWEIPPMMAFHAVQAFEEGGDIVLDLCESGPEVFDALTMENLRSGRPMKVPHRVMRYRLSPGATKATPEEIGRAAELPMVHGAYWTQRRAQFAWCAGWGDDYESPIFDRTVKLDLDGRCVAATWQREERNAAQMEPLFVHRPGSTGEEDGVLFVPTLADGDGATVVAVVDPARMECIAKLHLPQVVPFGFHAAWDQA